MLALDSVLLQRSENVSRLEPRNVGCIKSARKFLNAQICQKKDFPSIFLNISSTIRS